MVNASGARIPALPTPCTPGAGYAMVRETKWRPTASAMYPHTRTVKFTAMSRDFTLTPEQVRMARAALKWNTGELAREADINPNTVTKFENGGNVTIDTLAKIKAAFERAGIVWVPENGGAAGVRPPRRPKPEGSPAS